MRELDGAEQHFLFFAYLGRWVRTSIKTLFAGGGFSLSAWNLSCGFGSDMITTMAAYIGDPFSWLSVFFPYALAEQGYEFSIAARTFAATFSFFYYCKRMGFRDDTCVLCSLAYATGGHFLVAHLHPFFVNPMIWFPLAVVGTNRILGGKSPVLYIASVGASFLGYFYFGYMELLLLVPYCLISYLLASHKGVGKLRALFVTTLRFIGYSLLGVGIAAMLVLPTLFVVLGSDRLAVQHIVPMLYEGSMYREVVFSFVGYSSPGRDTFLGLGSAVLLCMLVAVSATRTLGPRGKAMLAYVAVLIAFLLIPWFGHALNGFSYVTNRWAWALSFAGCALAAFGYEALGSVGRKGRLVIAGMTLAYIALLLGLFDFSVARLLNGW